MVSRRHTIDPIRQSTGDTSAAQLNETGAETEWEDCDGGVNPEDTSGTCIITDRRRWKSKARGKARVRQGKRREDVPANQASKSRIGSGRRHGKGVDSSTSNLPAIIPAGTSSMGATVTQIYNGTRAEQTSAPRTCPAEISQSKSHLDFIHLYGSSVCKKVRLSFGSGIQEEAELLWPSRETQAEWTAQTLMDWMTRRRHI